MIGYYLVIFLNNLFLRAKILIKSDISKFYIHVSHVSSYPHRSPMEILFVLWVGSGYLPFYK